MYIVELKVKAPENVLIIILYYNLSHKGKVRLKTSH